MKFTVDRELDGQTVKNYFESCGFSTSQIKRFKYGGNISVNGETVTVRRVLRVGDVVELTSFERLKPLPESETPAQILYRDEWLYVAYKPFGVASHPDRTRSGETFGNMLASAFGSDFRLRIVTRLDKVTSGLVLGAFDEITAQKLNSLQRSHGINKRYLAVVEGILEQNEGTVNLSLSRKDSVNKTVADPSGKASETLFRIIERRENSTLVELVPVTGRTHQLRAHMSAVGHPIVGDVLYGAKPCNRVKLQCQSISFVHPYGKNAVDVCLPREF